MHRRLHRSTDLNIHPKLLQVGGDHGVELLSPGQALKLFNDQCS